MTAGHTEPAHVRPPVYDTAYTAAAREHLPAEALPRWRQLLKPAICLDHAADDEVVVGHFGGWEALLPPDLPWPEWEGYGPLSLWLTLDCAALPTPGEWGLPASGRLLFFFADGQLWGKRSASTVGADDSASLDSNLVVHVPDDVAVELRRAPEPLARVEPEPLTAWRDMTVPEYPEWEWRERFGDADERVLRVLGDDEFPDALDWSRNAGIQIGGHQYSMQDPVEEELVRYAVFRGEDVGEERFQRESARWRPLLQFFPFRETKVWCGDYWHLYWFIRDEDLAARRFDRALMMEQCT